MKPQANAGLFCELYWGKSLSEAWSFGPDQSHVHAAADEKAPLPLYGFTLPQEPFLLAERTAAGYRVFVPPAAKLERSTRGDEFHPVPDSQLVQHEGRASVELPEGTTLRLTQGELHLFLQHSVAKDRVARFRLRDFGWLLMVIVLFLSAPVGFLIAGPSPERMQESNARALAAAREKEAARRKALGIDTPLRPLTPQEQQQSDGGTPLKKMPGSLSVQ
ncbi:hypothetical protein [Hyalangium rubrum]|uniref:Uncharacterized protein n=1 Tax=Hyalangium rubrum TaxID=3103134 RepID=A0ABU5GVY0_9BACT|nr:hypothetical protein [Hyalangium sp. s54d21]MDY7225348.1 hypothetical protein [Hyalangium sp. s54d21]